MRKLDTKQFIRRAKAKHGNNYDYSHVVYINTDTKVKIQCKKHGLFDQRPSHHIKPRGCPKCGIKLNSEHQKKTKQQFIKDARRIHGKTYGYDKIEYKNSHTKIKMECKKHGFFNQTPSNHLNGRGCNECGNKSIGIKLMKSRKQFIKEAKRTHGNKYDYSHVDYVNTKSLVKIKCKVHGFFNQIPVNHLVGKGCHKCAMKSRGIKRRKSRKQFIKEAKKVWGKKYGYDKVEYLGDKIPLKIKCKIKDHGFFDQRPGNHLTGREGCEKCVDCFNSKGVRAIELFLKQNKIKYERERRFPDLRNKQPLPLDFWLPKLKIAIEFDGEQHSKISIFSATKDKLRLIQKRDRIKNKWVKKHGYTMIRISFIQLNNINEILLNEVA